MGTYHFKKDFIWGCATASYQVEGATFEDGRKPCIWDTFSKLPGKVHAGENGDVACDHYHRYKEDIALIKSLGFKSYRFSLAWPRIIPDGVGKVNPKAIEHYRSVLKELKANGISPMVTIYHWDLPQSLQDRGGWIARETAYAFQKYAEVCFDAFDEYVDSWITINEPLSVGHFSYLDGALAPGMKDISVMPAVIHHLNLAHGLALKSYNEKGLVKPVGVAWNAYAPRPATLSEENIKASILSRAFDTDVYMWPVLGRGYPEIVERELNLKFPIKEGDMDIISQKIGFIGINYYREPAVEWNEASITKTRRVPTWQDRTGIDWEVVPAGFTRLLKYIHSKGGETPIIITENGAAYDDKLEMDKRIHDVGRISFLQRHLKAVEEAIDAGVPVKGYYVWSLLDNYEWDCGYSMRFGIVYCDYKTLARYPKDSAYFMRDVMAGYGEY